MGAVIFTILFSIVFAFRNHHQFKEKSGFLISNKKWHYYQGALQLIVAGYIFTVEGWAMALVFVSVFWFLFDMILNKLNGKELLYVGGGTIDKLFKGAFGYRAPLVMIIVKVKFLATAISLYLWQTFQ